MYYAVIIAEKKITISIIFYSIKNRLAWGGRGVGGHIEKLIL